MIQAVLTKLQGLLLTNKAVSQELTRSNIRQDVCHSGLPLEKLPKPPSVSSKVSILAMALFVIVYPAQYIA